MKTQDWLAIGLLLWLLWPKRRAEEVSINIPGAQQECVFPDGTSAFVEIGKDCPFDDRYGGQSWPVVS